MSLDNAFKYIINLQGRDMTLERDAGNETYTVKAAPSNYYRNFAGMEEISVEGKEFVISKQSMDDASAGVPERGDVLIDSELGTNSIKDIKELVVFGTLVGFRVRTG